MIGVDCADCPRHTYIKDSTITPHWNGRCDVCRKKKPTKTIFKNKPLIGLDQMAYYEDRDGKEVPVECALKSCPRRPIFHIDRISEAVRKKKPLICKDHDLVEILQSKSPHGNGQKNRNTVKRRAGAPIAITNLDGFEAIDALGPHVSINKLASHLKRSRATVRAWIGRCGFKSLAELLAARHQKEDGNNSI
jgi:hypothetical protein